MKGEREQGTGDRKQGTEGRAADGLVSQSGGIETSTEITAWTAGEDTGVSPAPSLPLTSSSPSSSNSPLSDAARRLRRNPVALLCGAYMLLLVVAAICAPLVSRFGYAFRFSANPLCQRLPPQRHERRVKNAQIYGFVPQGKAQIAEERPVGSIAGRVILFRIGRRLMRSPRPETT